MWNGLLGGVLWALDTVLLSIAMAPFDLSWLAPVAATFLHDACSAFFLLAETLIEKKGRALWKVLQDPDSRWLIAAGILGGPIGMCGYSFSIRYLGPGLSSVISCLYPAVGALLGVLFLKEPFHRRQVVGLGISLAGILLISIGDIGIVPNFLAGLAFGLFGVLGWGIEGVAAQKAMKKEAVSNQQALVIRQCISSIAFAVVILPILRGWPLAVSMADSSSGLWILAAAAAGTLSYLNYYSAIHLIGSARAMSLNITYAAWAIVFSFLFFGTVPSLLQIISATMVVGGAIYCSGN